MALPFILLLYVLSINNFLVPTWVWVVMWMLYGVKVIVSLGDRIEKKRECKWN